MQNLKINLNLNIVAPFMRHVAPARWSICDEKVAII